MNDPGAPNVWLRTPLRWSRLDWGVSICLILAMFLTYARLWAPEPWRQWFPDGDFTDQFLAFTRLEVAELSAGRLPLWNPYAFAGSPFWADVQAAVAYPLSLANSLTHALLLGRMTVGGLELEAVLHLALAAVFTYAFAREELGARAGGVVAAVTFAFGGFLAGYPPLQLAVLETAIWLPVVLLGVKRLADARHASGAVLIASGVACTMLAGHPQTALYVGYTALAYTVWMAWPITRGSAGYFARAAGSVGLGVLAAAAGWLPALQFMRLSNRVQLPYEELAHGFPPAELVGLVLPGITHWAPLYVGLLALTLAIVALAAQRASVGERSTSVAERSASGGEQRASVGERSTSGGAQGTPLAERTHRPVAFWAGVTLVGVLLSLGGAGPLYDILFLGAPGWDLFRGQERAAYLASFGLSMLAGAGALAWRGDPRARGWVLRLTTGLAVILTAALLGGPDSVQPHALRGLFIVLAIATLAVVDRPEHRLPVRYWLAGVVAITCLDLAAATARTNLVDHPPADPAPSPLIATLRENAYGRIANHDRVPRNFGVMHAIEATSGSSPLRLATWDQLLAALEADEARLWQLLAVSQVVTWMESTPLPSVELLELAADDGATRVFALGTPLPRTWRVARAAVLTDAEAAARVAADDFEPLSEVLLSEGEAGVHSAGAASMQELGAGPGWASVRTEGGAAGWLVFSEMHYPGWRARVDGEPAPLLRADLALIAVPVPAGVHDVTIEFRPPIVYVALGLSALGWVGIALLAMRLVRGAHL